MFDIDVYRENTSKFNKVLDLYNRRHTNTLGTPLIMSFLVTNRCSLRCKHCFYHETLENKDIAAKREAELTIDEYEKISKSMEWFLTGIFCGGEPFLRDDFYEIINIFQKNNKIVVADSASNGQATDRIVGQVAKILQNSKYQTYSLGLSIDGFEEHHDEIRGKGTFNKLMETWKELKSLQKHYNNFEPYICTTMNTINQHSMEDFIKWSVTNLEPTKISLIKIRQNPRDGEYLKTVSHECYKKSVEAIKKYISEGLMGDVNKPQTYLLQSAYDYILETIRTGQRQFECYAGVHGGFIDYNGNVGICEIIESIGSLRESDYNFKALWNSENANRVRSYACTHKECGGCTHESEGLLPSMFFPPNQIKV